MSDLGKWALIDIETTGIDPAHDQIIDLGYLQFDGIKLVKKYSSLVRTDVELSQFIQKLTGITSGMVNRAPLWKEVEPHLLELEGHVLVAHNAKFEMSFLKKYFDENTYSDTSKREQYADSMLMFGLLFQQRSSFSLESFIVDLGIADSEKHRGLEDSIDLLRVMLLSTFIHKNSEEYWEHYNFMLTLLEQYKLEKFWFDKFLNLSSEELLQIASSIDFSLKEFADKYLEKKHVGQMQNSISRNPNTIPEFSKEGIERIFNDEARIRESLPGYQLRSSQIQLATKVGQSFKNSLHSLIQAPTGTGKTIGYLVPSVVFNMNSGEQILIATGTKELQKQAITKDVPLLRKFLSVGNDKPLIAELIGSNNHYCVLVFRNIQTEEKLNLFSNFEDNYVRIFFELLFYYNGANPPEKRINRTTIPGILKRIFPEFSELDTRIAVNYKACTASLCPFVGSCGYIGGIRRAKESNIIIANHALMFNWPSSFPRPRYIVVDEAHKIENEATEVFTSKINSEDVRILIKALSNFNGIGALFYLMSKDDDQSDISRIKKEIEILNSKIEDSYRGLNDLIPLHFKKSSKFSDIYWNELPMIDIRGGRDHVTVAIYNHLSQLQMLFDSLLQLIKPYLDRWDVTTLSEDNDIVAYTRFDVFCRNLEENYQALIAVMSDSEVYTRTIKYHDEYGFSIESAPVDVGRFVHDSLLVNSESVVYTSATLANMNGDQGTQGIEWTTGYTYLKTEKRFKSGFYLPPAFDYNKNARVFLCDDVPAIYSRDFTSTVLKNIKETVRAIGGRTLMLFSSKVRFHEAVEILLREFGNEIPVFIQGMGSNVVSDFLKSKSGILVGMESFSEGIDVPGEQLQFVFIDKIPDLRQDIVIDDRRKFFDKSFGNEFGDYFLAYRAISLQQKLGRLLRHELDRGAAIVVDPRIKQWKGNTINKFLNQMRPYQIERVPLKDASEKVVQFIMGS